MKDYTQETQEINGNDIPFYKRSEYWKSPLSILLIIGFIIFGIGYALYWVIKWILFSWMRPFSNSEFFCKIGLHKYRKQPYDPNDSLSSDYTIYKCNICRKLKYSYNDDY